MEAANTNPTTIRVRDYTVQAPLWGNSAHTATIGYKSYTWVGTGLMAMLPNEALAYATERPDGIMQIGHLVHLRNLDVRIIARHPSRPAYLVMREGRLARLAVWICNRMLENHEPTTPAPR